MLTEKQLHKSIMLLAQWMENNNFSSYDHYDLWSSKLGILGKQLFSKNMLAGLPLVSSIFFIDTFLPNSRTIFARKNHSAEALPRIALGYFHLYQATGQTRFLKCGCELLSWLISEASYTKHGLGWGLHFDWAGKLFIPKGTPCATLTAYVTEALLQAYRLTGKKEYLEKADRTKNFYMHDLNKEESLKSLKLSYTPIDKIHVINANSYAAWVLTLFCHPAGDDSITDCIKKLINYILDQQNADGSWYYFDRDEINVKNNFIDSFHSCFILKNLFHIWLWNQQASLKEAIDKGYSFLIGNFINSDFSVRYYAFYPYPTYVKVDIRCCAEMIDCLALLGDAFPDALKVALKIAEWTITNMQDDSGYYYFRIYLTHKNRLPSMRWGQAPMFNALTHLLLKLKGN